MKRIEKLAEAHVASMGKWERMGEVAPGRAEYVQAGYMAGYRQALEDAAHVAQYRTRLRFGGEYGDLIAKETADEIRAVADRED